MTTKKTLTLRDAPETTATIKKKGRGWEISEKRLDALHERAREMRRNPTPAQEALADALRNVETGGYKFQRQSVIGSAIVDFACKPLMLVVDLDGDEDSALSADRSRSLAEVGYRVERLSASAVLADPPAAAARVSDIMRERWHERKTRARSHPAPNRAPQRRQD